MYIFTENELKGETFNGSLRCHCLLEIYLNQISPSKISKPPVRIQHTPVYLVTLCHVLNRNTAS
jgi:hypothetical protein